MKFSIGNQTTAYTGLQRNIVGQEKYSGGKINSFGIDRPGLPADGYEEVELQDYEYEKITPEEQRSQLENGTYKDLALDSNYLHFNDEHNISAAPKEDYLTFWSSLLFVCIKKKTFCGNILLQTFGLDVNQC